MCVCLYVRLNLAEIINFNYKACSLKVQYNLICVKCGQNLSALSLFYFSADSAFTWSHHFTQQCSTVTKKYEKKIWINIDKINCIDMKCQ